jgi:hypothetical protein
MDRGMVSEKNLEFLRSQQRRYIVGTPKSLLRRFEAELTRHGWTEIRAGLEVKLCPGPEGQETFILCRSAERREKERAMHARAAERLEGALQALATAGAKKVLARVEADAPPAPDPSDPKKQPTARAAARAAERAAKEATRRAERVAQAVGETERRVGRLLQKYPRAARLFRVRVQAAPDGAISVTWERHELWREWSELSDGCYLLRSNVREWSAEELWKAYLQLTEAEAAFRVQKSDLELRPIWHQKEERVQAHILVCFLGYVLWKTLGKLCQGAGLGDEPRKVFQELSQLRMVDVVIPTRQGVELRRRCVERPDSHQAILLQRLGLELPESLEMREVV